MNAKIVDARHEVKVVLVVDIGGASVKVGTTGNRLAPLFTEPTPQGAESALNLVAALTLAAARVVGQPEGPRRRLVCGSGGLITPTGVCTKALYTPFAAVDVREAFVGRIRGELHSPNASTPPPPPLC